MSENKIYQDLKEKFESGSFKSDKDKTFEAALSKAYADMSRRATGHKPEMKDNCMEKLRPEFEEVIKSTFTSQEKFDNWHEELCGEILEAHGSLAQSVARKK